MIIFIHHTQENEHWHGEDEQIPVYESIKSGLLPDGYEQFFSDDYKLEDKTNSTEDPSYNQGQNYESVNPEQSEDLNQRVNEELIRILKYIKNPQNKVNHEFREMISKAVESTIISLRKEGEKNKKKIQSLIRESKNVVEFPKKPKPAPERKPADVLQMAGYQKPDQGIVRYDEDAKMYQFPGLS